MQLYVFSLSVAAPDEQTARRIANDMISNNPSRFASHLELLADAPRVLDFAGWADAVGDRMPTDVKPDDEVQIRTMEMPDGNGQWYRAGDVWGQHRSSIPTARVTQYRKR